MRYDSLDHHLGMVTFLGLLNVYEFGSDYILARDRDEEGVERVVEYQMAL